MAQPVHLEPAAKAFAAAAAKPPFLTQLGPEKGREALDKLQSSPIDKPDVDIEDVMVPGGPTGQVSVRIVRPKGAARPLPVVLYIHGAGWVFGDTLTHDRLIRVIATETQSAVVFPDYSRSPEAKYPTAIEQAYAVARWVVAQGQSHGLDGQRLAIAGDSVGGNMVAAVTLMAKQRGGPRFVLQVLFYPVTDSRFDTESYRQFATGYHLRRDMMEWFWDQYTSNPQQREEITASPLRATLEQLSGLPPALVITDEADVLRDEGEAYASKLRDAGVPVTAIRMLGTIHDFVMLNALAHTQAATGALLVATQSICQAFSRGAAKVQAA
jgi:acetyl esterase/lipase